MIACYRRATFEEFNNEKITNLYINNNLSRAVKPEISFEKLKVSNIDFRLWRVALAQYVVIQLSLTCRRTVITFKVVLVRGNTDVHSDLPTMKRSLYCSTSSILQSLQ